MADDSRIGILFIGSHRAAIHASWILAVVTGGGDRLLIRGGVLSSEKAADIAPGLAFIEAVERGTCGNASLATRAAVEGYLECVLLAKTGLGKGDQRTVMRSKIRFRVVLFRKLRDRGLEGGLLFQELVDEVSQNFKF